MSRCWKCAFTHQYHDDYDNPKGKAPKMRKENFKQTAFACNKPMSCAEDLEHHLCVSLPGPASKKWVDP